MEHRAAIRRQGALGSEDSTTRGVRDRVTGTLQAPTDPVAVLQEIETEAAGAICSRKPANSQPMRLEHEGPQPKRLARPTPTSLPDSQPQMRPRSGPVAREEAGTDVRTGRAGKHPAREQILPAQTRRPGPRRQVTPIQPPLPSRHPGLPVRFPLPGGDPPDRRKPTQATPAPPQCFPEARWRRGARGRVGEGVSRCLEDGAFQNRLQKYIDEPGVPTKTR